MRRKAREDEMKVKRVFCLNLCTMLFVLSVAVEAQQSTKIPRIGFLQRRVAPTPSNPDPLADAFRQGLRDLGYIEGKNSMVR